MKTAELARILAETDIPPDAYSLEGGLPNEAFCIGHYPDGNRWEVYYSERGRKSGLRTFDSEDDACGHFIEMMREAGVFK
ncbi:MAG TPA: hypothetical protein PKK43_02890 [Spirochaetota bacterium]|nr:hypothetical protein [Spirochaetota bacterium]